MYLNKKPKHFIATEVEKFIRMDQHHKKEIYRRQLQNYTLRVKFSMCLKFKWLPIRYNCLHIFNKCCTFLYVMVHTIQQLSLQNYKNNVGSSLQHLPPGRSQFTVKKYLPQRWEVYHECLSWKKDRRNQVHSSLSWIYTKDGLGSHIKR